MSDWIDWGEVYFTGQGSCHSIDSEAPYNVIDELRATVEELTGYSAPRQAMGFDLRIKWWMQRYLEFKSYGKHSNDSPRRDYRMNEQYDPVVAQIGFTQATLSTWAHIKPNPRKPRQSTLCTNSVTWRLSSLQSNHITSLSSNASSRWHCWIDYNQGDENE